jgi:bisphosphoglycerate-independent phosphoglycerate mutase (AlkP superfamily)
MVSSPEVATYDLQPEMPNPVPVLLMGGGDTTLAAGRLADVSPTLLELMGLPKPLKSTHSLTTALRRQVVR